MNFVKSSNQVLFLPSLEGEIDHLIWNQNSLLEMIEKYGLMIWILLIFGRINLGWTEFNLVWKNECIEEKLEIGVDLVWEGNSGFDSFAVRIFWRITFKREKVDLS
jgi:hypothetical protein